MLRETLARALETTNHREQFLTAARAVLAASDPKTRSALRGHLRKLLPEALATT